MLSAFKLFFSTSAGWVTLALVAALGIASYSYGHAEGYTTGHTKGFTEGRDSRDREVDHLKDNVAGLTTLINTERAANAAKIKTLEAQAADSAVATEKQLNQKIRARDAIIASYKADVKPEIQQHCGLSIDTVQAINALIQNVNEEPNEVPAPLTPAGDGSAADPGGGDTAGRTPDTIGESK